MNNHIQWAIAVLEKLTYQQIAPDPQLIQQAPWSEVFCFSTQQGKIYLKKTPPALAIEIQVIQLLKEKFGASVPTLIADNKEAHCFLMKDAGIPLREFFKQGFNADIFIHTVEAYSNLQVMTANAIEYFLDMGIPDWRLNKLPILYQALVKQETFLHQVGLTDEEINKCQNLIPTFQFICEKLSTYPIPDTFGHGDFHDNNVLIEPKTHQTTLIDLGEVVITHPFFSLLNMLYHTQKNCGLSHQQYTQLQKQVFKPWLKLESLANLQEVMTLIQRCGLIHAMLGIHRIMQSVDHAAFQKLSHEGRLAQKLRLWLNQHIN
jgi:hypothetical protein